MFTIWIDRNLAERLGKADNGDLMVTLDLGLTTESVRRVPHGVICHGVVLSNSLLGRIASSRDLIYMLDLFTKQGTFLTIAGGGNHYGLLATGGAPTIMISGVQMHRRDDPWRDSLTKARAVVRPGDWVLDTCGGLHYTALAALQLGAGLVLTTEPDKCVRGLRQRNPWSRPHGRTGMVSFSFTAQELVGNLPKASIDSVIHDPPRFSLAGELYGIAFYDALRRIMKPGAKIFHYTGVPYEKRRGRGFVRGVGRRLKDAGFTVSWDEQTKGFVGRMPR